MYIVNNFTKFTFFSVVSDYMIYELNIFSFLKNGFHMNYCKFIVTIICVATSRIICVSSVNSSSSVHLWKTSTASTIQEMLEKFSVLNTYQTVCGRPVYPPEKIYCHEFIKENNDYLTLKQVLEAKMKEVQYILVKLLALERKAIVCRGMRYLLAINVYSAFVGYASGGSTAKADVSEEDIFDDMFGTESEPNPAVSDHRNNKLEGIRQFAKDENHAFPNVRDTLNSNDTVDRGPETTADEHEAHVRGFVQKFKYIVRAIQSFVADLNDFREIIKTIDSIKVNGSASRRSPFSSVFRAINGVYAKECAPDVDAAAFLGADGVEEILRRDYSAAKLAEKIERLFGEVQRDIGPLFVRCYYMNHWHQFKPDVSMMYFHAFNKYYDSEVWRLIGDETVVDKSNSSSPPRSLNDVASKAARQIDRISEDLRLSVYNGLRCRSVVYVNVMIKLRYYALRVLVENVREVQRLAAALSARQKRVGEFVEIFAKNGAHHVAASITPGEFYDVFDEVHDVLAQLGIDERASDDSALSDTISSTINELNRNATVEKEFKSVFFMYSMFDWYLINEFVEDYQLKTNFFDKEFFSMLRDLKQSTVEVEGKTVEHILKWYKWGLQTYKDNCNSGIRTNISGEVKLKLISIISKMDKLYSDMDNDMVKMGKLFHF